MFSKAVALFYVVKVCLSLSPPFPLHRYPRNTAVHPLPLIQHHFRPTADLLRFPLATACFLAIPNYNQLHHA